MRYPAFSALLALLTTAGALAQTAIDDVGLREIESGAQWKVFERQDSSAVTPSGVPTRSTFAVFSAHVVDDLVAAGLLPAAEAEDVRDLLAAEGKDYRGVNDIFVVHLEAAEATTRESADVPPGDFKIADKGCSGWQDPKTFHGSWDQSHPGDFDPIHVGDGSFTGDLTVTLPISAEVSVAVTYQLKKRLCVPYKFRLLEATVTGEVAISNGQVVASAELDYTHEWKWHRHLHTFDLGSHTVWLGPVPVNLRFKLPLDFGIDTEVKAAGKAELRANLDATASFDVTCTSSSCDGPTDFDDDFDVADPVYDFTLDANARIWARAAVNVEVYDDDVGLASVGATGFVQAHLFGYLGNQCGDRDRDGSGDTIEDLLLDLDAGYEIVARLDGFLLRDEKEWRLLDGLWHLHLWDLWDDHEGWNVLDPLVTGPNNVEEGRMATYEFETRPCFPYSDDVSIEWTGPVTGSGSLTPGTGRLTASEVPVAGDHVLAVTMVGDTHGRDLRTSTSMPVTVGHSDFDQPHATDRFAQSVAGGDFDCDGYDDLAIGVPGEDAGSVSDTGLVTVLLADPAGNGLPTAVDRRVLHLFGDPGVTDADTRFGYELTVGDFNGDDCDDLAVGAPWDRQSEGVVQILYGADDPTALLAQRETLSLDDASFPENGESGDLLGKHMAAGDLDGDGFDDLVVTVPGRNKSSGAVLVAYGSPEGTGREVLIDQNTPGVPDAAEAGEGTAMDVALGDFDGDGIDDLAIGFPGEDNRSRDDGFVVVLYGTSTGLARAGNVGIGQGDLTRGGGNTKPENDDRFGWALAAGDFDGDGYDDLAIGSPGEAWGRTARTGIVQVVMGSVTGLSWRSGVQLLHQRKLGVEMADPSYFGSALAAADFNGDGYDDLAIGAYAKSQLFDDPEPETAAMAGETYVAYGLAGGIFDVVEGDGGTDGYVFSRATPGFEGPRIPGTRTGYSLAASDFNGDGLADLAIGSVGSEADGQPEAGSCNVLYGHPIRLSTLGSLYLEQSWAAASMPGGGGELINGVAETGLAGSAGSRTFYTIEVPAGATDLILDLSGGSGDADLYVRFGDPPSISTYDCRSWNSDNRETCSFASPRAGVYHVLIHGYAAYSEATLVASY